MNTALFLSNATALDLSNILTIGNSENLALRLRFARFTPNPALFQIGMTVSETPVETAQAMHFIGAWVLCAIRSRAEPARLLIYADRVGEFSPFVCWQNAFNQAQRFSRLDLFSPIEAASQESYVG